MTEAIAIDPGGDEALEQAMGGGPKARIIEEDIDVVDQLLAWIDWIKREMEELLEEMEDLDPLCDVSNRQYDGRVVEEKLKVAA